ncbi:MAG: SRPBCC family protein [Pseudohongiellaceae bacterium]
MNNQLSMFGEPENKSAPKITKVSLSKTIPASAEKLYDRWLIPTFAGNWMFGEHMGDDGVGDMNNEVRPGGAFNYTVIRGGCEVVCSGEYIVIDRPNKLSFSWHENGENTGLAIVEIQLEQTDDKTKLRVTLHVDRAVADNPSTIKQQWELRCKRLAAQLSRV